MFKSPSEYFEPFVAFLFSLGLAFGAYALLPLFLSHDLALSPQDRLTVMSGYPLL